MVKLFKRIALDQWPLLRIFLGGTPNILALELVADLLEWTVKVFLSMPARPSTSIIQHDTVEVEIALWGSIRLTNVETLFYDIFSFFLYVNQYGGKHSFF